MYLKKLRTALRQLSEKETNDIAKIARENLHRQEQIGDSVRAAHVTGYLKSFIDENKTSVKYLEAYFEAIEEWEPGFVCKVFFGERVRSSNTWHNLLIKVTNDVPSKTLVDYKDNDILMTELKTLFITLVESCVSDDPDETIQTFRTLNNVLERR
ncbi:hypothetical protein D7Z54_32240 [Salibacterium salarium]|uniref:Uncharacterized protein n=1 Tax=Salibacterium salarium TaxID=284579 RepID=A0A428MT08_9BACI|nr:hypothetical protein [Salibacterium salarium]RSL29258.1 hypothetical protein D7Z54_32240 [Salibacterium salarium]